jgi:hypothetical protein
MVLANPTHIMNPNSCRIMNPNSSLIANAIKCARPHLSLSQPARRDDEPMTDAVVGAGRSDDTALKNNCAFLATTQRV